MYCKSRLTWSGWAIPLRLRILCVCVDDDGVDFYWGMLGFRPTVRGPETLLMW